MESCALKSRNDLGCSDLKPRGDMSFDAVKPRNGVK